MPQSQPTVAVTDRELRQIFDYLRANPREAETILARMTPEEIDRLELITRSEETPADVTRGFTQGVKRGVTGLVSGLGGLMLQPPGVNIQQGVAMGEGMRETAGKAVEAAKAGRYSEMAGYGAATALAPIGGLWAADVGERAASGDVPGAVGEVVGSLGAGGAMGAMAGAARPVHVAPRPPLTPFERTRSPLLGTVEAVSEKSTAGRPTWERFRREQQAHLSRRGEEVQSTISPSRLGDERLGLKTSAEARAAAQERGRVLGELYQDIDRRIGNIRVDMRGLKATAKAQIYPLKVSAQHVATSELKKAIADLETAIEGPDSASFEVAQHVRSNLLAAERGMREALPDRGARIVQKLERTVTDAMHDTAAKGGTSVQWRLANQAWAKYKRDFHRGGLMAKLTTGVEREAVAPEQVADIYARASALDRARLQRYVSPDTTQALKGNLVGRWIREATSGELTKDAASTIAAQTGGAVPVSTPQHSGRQLMRRIETQGRRLLDRGETKRLVALADEYDRMSTRGRQEASLMTQSLNIGAPISAATMLVGGRPEAAATIAGGYGVVQFLAFLEAKLATNPNLLARYKTTINNAAWGAARGAEVSPALQSKERTTSEPMRH